MCVIIPSFKQKPQSFGSTWMLFLPGKSGVGISYMPLALGTRPFERMYCMSLRVSLCQCLHRKHGVFSSQLGIAMTPAGPFGVEMTVGARHPVSSESFAISELSAWPARFVNSVLTETSACAESRGMANQVMTVLEPQLPCEPDLGALSQMAAPIVMVHKITRGEKGKENPQLVINGAQGMSMEEILQLQDQLPAGRVPNSGPGVYRFNITDRDSAAKTSWQTRLGGAAVEAPPAAQALPFNVPPTAAAVRPMVVPQTPAVVSPTVRQIGNGFSYDPELELLTLPDGTAHPWRRGQPLPAAATTPMSASAPVSAPVSHLAGPGVPFFAPPSPELEATKTALAQAQRQLEEMQRQKEQERREMMHQQEMAELRGAIAELTKQLTTRPAENPELAGIKQRIERQDELAMLRAESKAQIDAIMALVREQGNNNRGIDPMVTFMTSMMKDGQVATAETLRLIRETAGAERQTFLTMLDRQAAAAEKAAANNPFEKVSGIFDVLIDKFGRIAQLEREFSGSGGGTDWVAVFKEVASKAGSAVEMYQSAKAQEARAAEASARAQIATAQASVSRDRALVAVQGGKAAPRAPQAPAAVVPAAASRAPQGTVGPAKPAASTTRVKVELPDLEKATLPELREVFGPERDEVFFGAFFEHVKQLRAAVSASPATFSAKKIAGALVQAREYLVGEAEAGRPVPHAAEIWGHGQTGYLLERLLPEASEGLRGEVVKALLQLEAESADAERVAANTAAGEEEGE